MQKRIVIVHGWASDSEDCWFPWLRKELEKKNFEVVVPAMPNPEKPEIDSWVSYLAKIVGAVDENTFFVGHSVGSQTILRFLEKLLDDVKIGGAVFVGGWLTLAGLETEEEKAIARPWLETPIDFDKIKQHTKKFFAILSDNDPWVPLTLNKTIFENQLGATVVIEHHKGHFMKSDDVFKLPSVLDILLTITK